MHRTWIERVARAGFTAKAIVYLLLGYLAGSVALGARGRLTDSRGVVTDLLGRPHGRVLVGVLALGLAGYALWRFLEAFADANHKGSHPRALWTRGVYALSGIVYGTLAFDAVQLVRAGAGGSSGHTSFVGSLARSGSGPYLLVAAALVLMVYGAKQVRDAFRGELSHRLNLGTAVREAGRWVLMVSRAGIAARGVVFALTGVLVLRLAVSSPVAAARTDTSDSLRYVEALPSGRLGLLVIAAGLAAYGVYQLVHARYRRISPP